MKSNLEQMEAAFITSKEEEAQLAKTVQQILMVDILKNPVKFANKQSAVDGVNTFVQKSVGLTRESLPDPVLSRITAILKLSGPVASSSSKETDPARKKAKKENKETSNKDPVLFNTILHSFTNFRHRISIALLLSCVWHKTHPI